MESHNISLSNKIRISKLTAALRNALPSDCEESTTNITNLSNLLKTLWSILEDIDANEIVESLEENEVNGLLKVLELVNVHQLTLHLHEQQTQEMGHSTEVVMQNKQKFTSSSAENDIEPCSSTDIAYTIRISVLKPKDVVSGTDINSQDIGIVAENSEKRKESEEIREQIYNLFEEMTAEKIITILETIAKDRKTAFPFNIKLNTLIDYVTSMEFDDLVYLHNRLQFEHSVSTSNSKNNRKRERAVKTREEDHTFLPKKRKQELQQNIDNNLKKTVIKGDFTEKLNIGFMPIQGSIHPNVIEKPECFKNNNELSPENSDCVLSCIDSKYTENDIDNLIENIKTEYCLNNYSEIDSKSQGFNDILDNFTFDDILSLKDRIQEAVRSSPDVKLQISVESLLDETDVDSQSSDDSIVMNLKKFVSNIKFNEIDESLNETFWQRMFEYIDNFDLQDPPKAVKKSKDKKNKPKLLKNSRTGKLYLSKYEEFLKREKVPNNLKIDQPKLSNIERFKSCVLLKNHKSTNTIDLFNKLDQELFKKTPQKDMIDVSQHDKNAYVVDLVKKYPVAIKQNILVDSHNTTNVDNFLKYINHVENCDPKKTKLGDILEENKQFVNFSNKKGYKAKYEKMIEEHSLDDISKETNDDQNAEIKNKNLFFLDSDKKIYGNSTHSENNLESQLVAKDACLSPIDDTKTYLSVRNIPLAKNSKSLPSIPASIRTTSENENDCPEIKEMANNINDLKKNVDEENKKTITDELESYSDFKKNLIELNERELLQFPNRIALEILSCSSTFDELLLDEICLLEKAPINNKVEIIKMFLTKINLNYPGITSTAENSAIDSPRGELDISKLDNLELIHKKSKKLSVVDKKNLELIDNSSGTSDETDDDQLPFSLDPCQIVNTDATQREDLLKCNHEFVSKGPCHTLTDKIQTGYDNLIDIDQKPIPSDSRQIKEPEINQGNNSTLISSDSCDEEGNQLSFLNYLHRAPHIDETFEDLLENDHKFVLNDSSNISTDKGEHHNVFAIGHEFTPGSCQILDTDKAQHNVHATISSCSIDEIKTVDKQRNNTQPEYPEFNRSLSEMIENITRRTGEITISNISNSTVNPERTHSYYFNRDLLEMTTTLREFIKRRLEEE